MDNDPSDNNPADLHEARLNRSCRAMLQVLATPLPTAAMNTMIDELDVVSVKALLQTDRQFSGSDGVRRAPRIGDMAAVVHVLEPGRAFMVEAVDSEGYTLWVADFLAEELQLETKYRSGV
jgi:hypothetical protein